MQENEILMNAIEVANRNGHFFCKFISANDVGINGAHQEGIYLNKNSWSMFFDIPMPTTGILDRKVKIHIDDWKTFESRIVYYTSKKEFRITQFWTNTPYEKQEVVGALIVFIPVSPEDYKVYLFNTEQEIEDFIDTFSLSLINNFSVYRTDTGQKLEVFPTLEDRVNELIRGIEMFPTTAVMSQISRDVFMEFSKKKKITPDTDLLDWVDTEYTVFRLLERHIYRDKLVKPFLDIEPLLEFANTALNRRKSRAGRSLEHHINFIFSSIGLPFDNPGKTEGKKKPDFLLPSTKEYKDESYPDDKLIMLGAKTTCKDRWRQVLNEANRIPHKHLLTLQQGISKNQMDEMHQENLTLVVPKPLHKFYPKEYQERLWTLDRFIRFAHEKYNV
ncbi:restriction endonuclease [Lysinibacillus sp. YS11]|uniref:type II restriction endonuclease n=1 Tax=Lysinibacillus sp. YS11 TaxID=2072025 RepID=UPI000CA15745|nr:type II restriction endonuclease [Lysinibacillus sp. YS11]AUS88197.1 restriction endonuclease [Lysinibacillus sp. YS11]